MAMSYILAVSSDSGAEDTRYEFVSLGDTLTAARMIHVHGAADACGLRIVANCDRYTSLYHMVDILSRIQGMDLDIEVSWTLAGVTDADEHNTLRHILQGIAMCE